MYQGNKLFSATCGKVAVLQQNSQFESTGNQNYQTCVSKVNNYPTLRQSVTHAHTHWILRSSGILSQMSCKSFLKFQVGITSPGALFYESRVDTKSP